jgi:hypothetical protein
MGVCFLFNLSITIEKANIAFIKTDNTHPVIITNSLKAVGTVK